MPDDDIRKSWKNPAVPAVGPKLAWWQEAEMFLLRQVVGPWRRRRKAATLPPPLTAEETARRLFSLPISYWTYDFEPGVRHLGPMSQDFAGAFGLGNTNRKIHMVDANGVAVVAVQVLNRRLVALQKEVQRLSTELESRVGQPTTRVSASGQPGGFGDAMVNASPDTGPGQDERTTDMTNHEPTVDVDDVQGHKFYSSSDRAIKEDIALVVSEEQVDDDVDGHRVYANSDRTLKHDVQPMVSEEEDEQATDDVEGHATRVRV